MPEKVDDWVALFLSVEVACQFMIQDTGFFHTKNFLLMKKLYTFFLLFFTAVWTLSAQVVESRGFRLEVTNLPGLEGPYDLLPALFGSQDYCELVDNPIVGEWIIVDDGEGSSTSDGCEEIDNDLTGAVALIDRGACFFGYKCFYAQEAGAVAAIVCNNQPGLVYMAPDPDGFADQVTIPCFMMSKEDCDLIRTNIPGVTVSVQTTDPVIDVSTDVVIWGDQAGEGDFDGGLNGWTVNNIACGDGSVPTVDLWEWNATGSAVGGGAFSAGTQINSYTPCNGAMVFNSDYLDNGGDSNNQGGGPCPAFQVGELISPTIDVSGTTAPGVSLVFVQALSNFQIAYWVGWSVDDGVTWDSVLINDQYASGELNVSEIKRVPLPGAVGTSTLRVKFRCEANYYAWIIDDVRIVEQEGYNLKVNENFYAIPPNAQFPVGQTDPIPFLADFSNVGALDQDDVVLTANAVDPDGNDVFSSQLDYGTVPANTVIENNVFGMYVPDANAPQGLYTGAYGITSPNDDFDEGDNSITFNFKVTENVFAKELGVSRGVLPGSGNWDPGEAHSWGYGNVFYIANATDPSGNPMRLSGGSFYVRNASEMAGRTVTLFLYTWDDASGNNDGNADPNERNRVALGFYAIQGTEGSEDEIFVEMKDYTGEDYFFEPETYYILMLEYTTEDEQTLVMGANGENNYGAMIFTTDSLEMPRYASMLAINADLTDETFDYIGFGFDLVPAVRMYVDFTTDTKELPAGNSVKLSPNPAREYVNVAFDLDKAYQDAELQVYDLNGRLVLRRQLYSVQKGDFQLDLQGLEAGSYTLKLVTEDGSLSRKLIVQ